MADYLDGTSTQEPDDPRSLEEYQRRYMGEIERAERYFQTWQRKGEQLIKLYRKQADEERQKRKFAMLWANTEVLKPTLYARTPEPIIERRYKDEDPAGRMAGELLERASAYIFDKADFHSCMKAVRDDCLLPGRGTAWVRFIEDGKIAIDYVHWRDFVHQPARSWAEVTWLAKRNYLSKEEMRERFPDADLQQVKPENLPKGGISEEEKKALQGKYIVWELWDKAKRRVCMLSPSGKVPLEISQPYVALENFWPTPRPLWATTTTDSLIPVPDFKYYQDQAEEIDDLTRRIASMTDSLKLVGFYPKGSESTTEIEKALNPGVENKMIGVESWAAFAERGGVKAIVFLPIEEVVNTIKACIELRMQLIQDVYQITGISDIMRGSTDPNETLGAQQLKAQTGSVRIRDRQQEIQRFARDMLEITAEIIAANFTPQTLLQMTNMATEENNTPEAKMALEGALQMLQDKRILGFRIDIETDSTVYPDENTEKQSRVEFAKAMGELFVAAVPLVQQVPLLLPLVGETIRFVTRGFRVGRELEDEVERTMKQLEADVEQKMQAAQNQPPQPSKEQIDKERLDQIDKPKSQAEIALIQAQAAKTQSEALVAPAKIALEQDKVFLGLHEGIAEREQKGAEADADRQAQAQAQSADHEQQEADRQAQGAQFAATRQDNQAQAEIDNQGAAQDRLIQMQGLAAKANGGNGQQAGQVSSAPPGMPPSPPQPMPGPPAPGQGIAQLLQALAASTMQNSQAIEQLAQVMALPTVVETPRGTYTARKMMQ